MTLKEIQKIIKHITFLKSCVNMGWRWKVRKSTSKVITIDENGKKKKEKINGFMICCSFQRPDINTGIVGTGYGRWMWINEDADESSIVKTAYVCAELIVKHELMEAMLYRKAKIFDPHKNISQLAYPDILKYSKKEKKNIKNA